MIYFHSIMNYGLIFWGNYSYNNNILRLQKRITIIILGARTGDSCRELFKILKILPLHSQYIWPLVLFNVNKKHKITTNSEIHSINTSNNSYLFQPLAHLMTYHKGPYQGV